MPTGKSSSEKSTAKSLVPTERIDRVILRIRGQNVMLDSELASLYGVTTKRLNEQVRRNRERFPVDFMFQLTAAEAEVLRSQIATSKPGRGGRRHIPYAFTEHGAVMLASVLKSPRAVEASIFVARAFVRLREWAATNKELAAKLADLERRVGGHDESIRSLVAAIRQLMAPPPAKKTKIGFHQEKG